MPSKTGSGIVPNSFDADRNHERLADHSMKRLEIHDHVTRNLQLVQNVIQRELADEALLEQSPEGVRLVLLPTDDVALAHANIDMAIELARRGERIKLQIVPARVGLIASV